MTSKTHFYVQNSSIKPFHIPGQVIQGPSSLLLLQRKTTSAVCSNIVTVQRWHNIIELGVGLSICVYIQKAVCLSLKMSLLHYYVKCANKVLFGWLAPTQHDCSNLTFFELIIYIQWNTSKKKQGKCLTFYPIIIILFYLVVNPSDNLTREYLFKRLQAFITREWMHS